MIYAKKKVLNKCIFCKKYKASKQGKRDNIQRFKCSNCGKWFLKNSEINNKKTSISKSLNKNNLLLDHLEGISYRSLEYRYNIPKKKFVPS